MCYNSFLCSKRFLLLRYCIEFSLKWTGNWKKFWLQAQTSVTQLCIWLLFLPHSTSTTQVFYRSVSFWIILTVDIRTDLTASKENSMLGDTVNYHFEDRIKYTFNFIWFSNCFVNSLLKSCDFLAWGFWIKFFVYRAR